MITKNVISVCLLLSVLFTASLGFKYVEQELSESAFNEAEETDIIEGSDVEEEKHALQEEYLLSTDGGEVQTTTEGEPESTTTPGDDGLSGGEIAAIVICSSVGVVAIGGGGYAYYKSTQSGEDLAFSSLDRPTSYNSSGNVYDNNTYDSSEGPLNSFVEDKPTVGTFKSTSTGF